ncbi:MAG: hypothetical protein ACI4B3_06025 [Prevotella sp.]
MVKKTNWTDDYWLYIMQLYMRKPMGVKPLYARAAVDLSIELHVHPREIRVRQQQLEAISSPRIERIWDQYAESPKKLSRAVRLLRSMKGFGSADEFYDGVEITESFERDFKPIGNSTLTPVILILVLDLYFRLTPITMVAETPEVIELAKKIGEKPNTIVSILQTFRRQDPLLSSQNAVTGGLPAPLESACKQIWTRYGNGDTETLEQFAAELWEYYK